MEKSLWVRAALAVTMVIGGMVLFGFDKLDFAQLMAFSAPPITLYFGQYISTPGK